MGERRRERIAIHGGMEDQGDPALAAEGVCELLKNVEYIENGLYARLPFVSDYSGSETPLGLFRWEDTANRVERLMALLQIEPGSGQLLRKATSGEVWATVGSVGDVTTAPVAAYANYRGIVYFCLNDGVLVPTATYSYDGTSIRSGVAVPGLTARLVVVFRERVYYGNLQLVVTSQISANAAYDPTQWTLTNVAAVKKTTVVSGRTVVVWQIVPTAATGGKMELASVYTLTSAADPTKLQLLVMLAGADAIYRMPMTVQLVFRGQPWETARAFVLGARRHPVTPNGYVYVCTQAGTTGGSEPAWPTTIGTEVTDNTAKWKCESVDVVASSKIEVPSTSDSTDPASFYVEAVIPPVVSSYTLMLRYSFGTTSTPSVSLLPVAFSMDDGQADGVLTKKNFAQQLTVGAFQYPFRNIGGTTATLSMPDMEVWTEPGEPDVILAENSVIMAEQPGDLTALAVAGGRKWSFKRRATWAYVASEDPVFPIIREKVYNNIGSISAKGVDSLDDLLFVIGEHQISGFNAAESPIQPVGLCPEGIRRTIMGRGPTWVESISASNGQAYSAILRVHPRRRQLWVHTQDRKIFIHDLEGKRWSYFEIPKSGGLARIRDIEWNPTTDRMMVVCENGIVRHAKREEQGTVAAIAVTAAGSGYSGTPTVALSAPQQPGGVQATATVTVAAGAVTALTVTNAGSGYTAPPSVTFSGGGGTGAAATARLMLRDTNAAGTAFASEKWLIPKPFEVRPGRPVMTVDDLALYGKITMDQALSTCEVDISFDGGETFTKFNRVRLTPLSVVTTIHPGQKRRYPIPIRKTGESVTVTVRHIGDTGNDVFNVLDMDTQIVVRGPEQPKTRPTGVAKSL